MILPPLTRGRLIRRYKRFLADVRLEDGSTVTVHVPNTGSMKSTSAPGRLVGLAAHDNPKRKYRYTLELIEGDDGGALVGVNTMRTNRIVEEAVRNKEIPELLGYPEIRREVPYGEASRIDLLLVDGARLCYVEVKNVTYKEGAVALFPDAVTARGTKHSAELSRVVAAGHRGVIFFLINRGDCNAMAAARDIDPVYADALERAAEKGVELIAYRTRTSFSEIALDRKVHIAHISAEG